ncbi:MAG: TolC family protein [Porticoccaceae bacterium]|nr:TolC family protein [Porticoccaceae bacterium]
MSSVTRLTLISLVGICDLCATIGSLSYAESLEDAWQLALSGNFKIKAAEQQEFAADSQLASANAERLPSLVLAADYLKLDDKPTFEADIGNPTPFIVSYFDEESAYYSASTTLPLYTGGRITADINAAKAQRSAAIANTSHSISSVKIAVARAYIDILRTQSAVELAGSHVESLASHQSDVENLLGQGLVARNNLLTANVALADARQQLLQTNHQSELAKANYNRLLNRALDTEFALEPLNSPKSVLPVTELSAQALSRRADIQTLKHRSEVLDETAKVAKAASKPQFGLSSTYLHHNNRINTDQDVLAANVSMVWNVFDGGVSRHRSMQLQRQAAAVKAQEDELSGLVALQVRQAWLAFQAAQQGIEITRDSIEQAEENLSSSENRFQAGLITNSEVLDAENLRVQAHSNHSNATYDAALAALQLKYVAGLL